MKRHTDQQTRMRRIHFVGIGGSGMAGIAEVLHTLGYLVSGSDINETHTTKRLAQLGITVYIGHKKKNISDAQALVVSSAIDDTNVEIAAAKKDNIPLVPRAEMLAELMRFRYGIAISGTHGKTTVTSLIAHILNSAQLDPTFIIGGVLKTTQSNARLGDGDYLVAEADESDASFLKLKPMLSVITNIDNDHLQTYHNDMSELDNAFLHFISNLPFYGVCVLCADDAGVKRILPNVSRPIVRYGLSEQCDIQASAVSPGKSNTHFSVVDHIREQTFDINLNLIGNHNVLNTLAAVAVCLEIGVDVNNIQRALTEFKGVGRRLERYDDVMINTKHVTLFDDYGHHPNEIKAVVDTLRQSYPERRLLLIFQAHRYSRTHALFDDFVNELSRVDVLLLTDIYTANEKAIPGTTATALANSIRQRQNVDPIVTDITNVVSVLANVVEDNDLIVTMGAGSIGGLVSEITQQ